MLKLYLSFMCARNLLGKMGSQTVLYILQEITHLHSMKNAVIVLLILRIANICYDHFEIDVHSEEVMGSSPRHGA